MRKWMCVGVVFSRGSTSLGENTYTVKIRGFNGSIGSRYTKNEQLTKIQT